MTMSVTKIMVKTITITISKTMTKTMTKKHKTKTQDKDIDTRQRHKTETQDKDTSQRQKTKTQGHKTRTKTMTKNTERVLACGGQSTKFPVLLHSGAHPVDLGVPGDRRVVDVDHDHLVVPEGEGVELGSNCT